MDPTFESLALVFSFDEISIELKCVYAFPIQIEKRQNRVRMIMGDTLNTDRQSGRASVPAPSVLTACLTCSDFEGRVSRTYFGPSRPQNSRIRSTLGEYDWTRDLCQLLSQLFDVALCLPRSSFENRKISQGLRDRRQIEAFFNPFVSVHLREGRALNHSRPAIFSFSNIIFGNAIVSEHIE